MASGVTSAVCTGRPYAVGPAMHADSVEDRPFGDGRIIAAQSSA